MRTLVVVSKPKDWPLELPRVEVVHARAYLSDRGYVVPESVSGRAEWEGRILIPMYRDIAPYDTAGIQQQERLNSRGAIARFDRDAIEIRVLDIQECPLANIARRRRRAHPSATARRVPRALRMPAGGRTVSSLKLAVPGTCN